jgi:hypothetical protein
VQRHALDVEAIKQLGREVEPGRRRSRRPARTRVHGLVPLRVRERLGDVGRKRRLPRRLAVEAQPPAAFAEMLEELQVAVPASRAQASRRSRQPLPLVIADLFEQQHLPARPLDRDPRGKHARVVDDDELLAELVREVAEDAVPHVARRPLVHEQAGFVAPLRGMLRDQLRRQVVVELGDLHVRRGP